MSQPIQRSAYFIAVAAVFVLVGLTTYLHAQDARIGDDVAQEVNAETSGTPYPPELDDPSIALDELELKVLPLTADELKSLSEAWLENAQAATAALTDKIIEIRNSGDAVTDKQRDERLSLAERRRQIFERFALVISSLEAKGGDPEFVESLRTYAAAVAIQGSSRMTYRELADYLLKWLRSPDGGIQVIISVAVIVASLLGLLVVARVARGWALRFFGRIPKLSKLLQGFLAMTVYWLVIAFGLMIVLGALGVDITPLFALVGGASFILAFAMQDTLGNLAAGLMIMINRPFDEGDYVTVAGVGGTVKHVSVVSTTVTTPDNQVIVIPNSKVWGDVITNVTASETRRVDLVFGIGYDDSIEEAQKTLEKVVNEHPKVLSDPPAVIRVNTLNDSSVDFIVRPWVNAEHYWDVYWDLTLQVKEAFDARGISIPFPQTEMRIRGDRHAVAPLLSGET